jgi:autotransporter strand-loop-strand O-heptosyltransferase
MKTILIEILSTSIGDTIASTPYVSEYQKKNDCKIYYKINGRLIPFLENVYTNINFIDKKTIVEFDEEIILKYIFSKNVQGGFAEQLGFENPTYIRPKITIPDSVRTIKNKYITFGVHSTGQIRYWNHPTGIKSQPSTPNWNDLSGRLRKLGYTPVTVEKDELFGTPPFFNGVPSKSNKKIGIDLLESLQLIQHSEFYIGLNSGMAWLSHALGKKVVMISNFSEDWNEFDLSLDD